MVPCPCLEHMRAVGAGGAARRAEAPRCAFIVRLVSQDALAGAEFARLPSPLERIPVALRTVALQELAVRPDPPCNEILARLPKDRPALIAVGSQQCVASPPLQLRRQLPSQIGHIFKPVVQSECAIARRRGGSISDDV